jgi:hypothetical protein
MPAAAKPLTSKSENRVMLEAPTTNAISFYVREQFVLFSPPSKMSLMSANRMGIDLLKLTIFIVKM